jgi:tetratricopeptide (TPR) repeat protein
MLKLQEEEMKATESRDFRQYLRQPPVMLTVFAVIAVAFFLAVTGLSRAYHSQRENLGNRWFNRGLADLNTRHFESAITEFRSALLYSRDNYGYQLNLAEALIGLKRTGEASAYLVNLWERQPEDGVVNLELARIAVQRMQTEQAERYYHNAIYAAWPSDQEAKRRDARLELIEFLLNISAKAQAQAELIALSENMGDDPAQQRRLGDLFLRAQDYEHALTAYHVSLESDRHNQAALAGAGAAAFYLGRYAVAERYLKAATAKNPNDASSSERLKTAELVLRMDPFRHQISMAQRDRIVVEAFGAAGQRLKSCGVKATGEPSDLNESWSKLQPRITEGNLRRDPDLVESAMDVAFRIERQSSTMCEPPQGIDMALLLIAKLHEGN